MKYKILEENTDKITCELAEICPSQISITSKGQVMYGNKNITENLDEDSHGYYIFPYKIEGLEMKFPTVHQIVYKLFNNTRGQVYLHHKDGNKHNNSLSNLIKYDHRKQHNIWEYLLKHENNTFRAYNERKVEIKEIINILKQFNNSKSFNSIIKIEIDGKNEFDNIDDVISFLYSHGKEEYIISFPSWSALVRNNDDETYYLVTKEFIINLE